MRFLAFLGLPLLLWLLLSSREHTRADEPADKVNLALRRVADAVLRQAGDSTSRIPAVEHTGIGVWRLRLNRPFYYDSLPVHLQSAFDLYGITGAYEVAIRRCEDDVIDLGFHQQDFLEDGTIPCGGREMPEGCHYLEVQFEHSDSQWAGKAALALLLLAGAGFWWYSRRKKAPAPEQDQVEWLSFGNSRLDVAGLRLQCNGEIQSLTFREAKLLRLFADNPNRLLERAFILENVWADEGVWVGRSVDVFVSRLRKKLAADPSVGIVAVHGVGYRMELK